MDSPQIIYCQGFVSSLFSDIELRDTVHYKATQFRRSFLARRLPDHSSKKFSFRNNSFWPAADPESTLYGFIMYFGAPAVNDGQKDLHFVRSTLEFCKFYDLYLYFFDEKYRIDDYRLLLDDEGAKMFDILSKLKVK